VDVVEVLRRFGSGRSRNLRGGGVHPDDVVGVGDEEGGSHVTVRLQHDSADDDELDVMVGQRRDQP
jgi:hypothetical protein